MAATFQNIRSAFMIILLLSNQAVASHMSISECENVSQEVEEQIVRSNRSKKNKTYGNLFIRKALQATTVTVAGAITASSFQTPSGNQIIRGDLTVQGNETVNGQFTLANPVIAVATGVNILDYAYFSTKATQALASENCVVFSNTSANINSTGITLAGDQQTITFSNTGIYLITAYMVGSSSSSKTGFQFSFANPGGGNRFSGGAPTIIGDIITMSGSAIVACDAGRTMQLMNISPRTFALSNGGLIDTTTAGISIIRLR